MSVIVNTGASAVLLQQALQAPPKELLAKAPEKQNFSDKAEIRDTASFSSVSKNLNESGGGNVPLLSPDNLSQSVDSVRVFILNHKENAIEQQANQ